MKLLLGLILLFGLILSIFLYSPLYSFSQDPEEGDEIIDPKTHDTTSNKQAQAATNASQLPRDSIKRISLSNNTGFSLLPRVTSTPGRDNVYVIWSDNSTGNYDILFKRSIDRGATFSDTINLSDDHGVSFYPRVFAIPESNNVYVVWVDNSAADDNGSVKPRGQQQSDILFRRSIDGGATFSDTINLSNNEGLSLLPQIDISGTFKVYVTWTDNSTGNYDILFRRSIDGGATFSDTINLSNNQDLSLYSQISSISGSNNVYIVWVDKSGGQTTGQTQQSDILFRRSIDGGATFSDTINLSNNEGLSLLPKVVSATIPRSNNVYAVWVDENGGGSINSTIGQQQSDILFRRSIDGGATFSDTINLSNNEGLSERLKTQITAYNPEIETSGTNMYIVWENHNTGRYLQKVDLFIKLSSNSGTTFSNEFGLNLSQNIGTSINPQISASDNNIYVVWQDNSTQRALPNTTYDILFKHSDNSGQKFYRTIDLSEGSQPSINPQISASDNNIYVVWQDSTYQGKQEVFFSKISIPE